MEEKFESLWMSRSFTLKLLASKLSRSTHRLHRSRRDVEGMGGGRATIGCRSAWSHRCTWTAILEPCIQAQSVQILWNWGTFLVRNLTFPSQNRGATVFRRLGGGGAFFWLEVNSLQNYQQKVSKSNLFSEICKKCLGATKMSKFSEKCVRQSDSFQTIRQFPEF